MSKKQSGGSKKDNAGFEIRDLNDSDIPFPLPKPPFTPVGHAVPEGILPTRRAREKMMQDLVEALQGHEFSSDTDASEGSGVVEEL